MPDMGNNMPEVVIIKLEIPRGVFIIKFHIEFGIYKVLFPGMQNGEGYDPTPKGEELNYPWSSLAEDFTKYFDGEPVSFDHYPLETRSLTEFQKKVLTEVKKIPRGEVVTYSELAIRINRPGAQRAVGKALANNPHLLIVPCHRVVSASGNIGGYRAGVDWKKDLLSIERSI